MKKLNLLSKAEMKNVIGGITPEMANCEASAWRQMIVDQDGNCRFHNYTFCQNWCSQEFCNFDGACTLTEV
ncbi:MAG: hypothetical protein EOO93_11645 [Pedobacter sp.]|nr:MAG: hypothetical protein EOO93_11645 [Pedobacter sp.]